MYFLKINLSKKSNTFYFCGNENRIIDKDQENIADYTINFCNKLPSRS